MKKQLFITAIISILVLSLMVSSVLGAAGCEETGTNGTNVTNGTTVWRWEVISIYKNWTNVSGYVVEQNSSGSAANTTWAVATLNWTNFTVDVNATTAGAGFGVKIFVYQIQWNDSGGNLSSGSGYTWQWIADGTVPLHTAILNSSEVQVYSPDYPRYKYINVSDNLQESTSTGIHTVLIEHNATGTATNYSMTGGTTSGNWSYSHYPKPALGTSHTWYYWKFWFNDTSDNWNKSTSAGGTYNETVLYASIAGGGGGGVVEDEPVCGDGVCEEDEDQFTCPEDCGEPEQEETVVIPKEKTAVDQPKYEEEKVWEGLKLTPQTAFIAFMGIMVVIVVIILIWSTRSK